MDAGLKPFTNKQQDETTTRRNDTERAMLVRGREVVVVVARILERVAA